ncbi:MAG: hypothetical protein Kow0068_08980 [Marinilabiliales bacterium]
MMKNTRSLILFLLIIHFVDIIEAENLVKRKNQIIKSKSSRDTIDCSLTYLTTIEGYNVWLHDSSGAIIFRAKMAIDADGSPRAYGPNDSGLDWTANAGYTGNWWGVVTDINGDPVIQGPGDPYPGMYVSTTSLVCAGYAETDPRRYVDSENVPYIALPYSLQSLCGISMGDFVYVRNTLNDSTSYAYLADTGPSGKLGEGSILLADRLGINSNPRTGGVSQPVIDYVIFPQSGYGNGTCLDSTQIDSLAEVFLINAGGYSLPDCIDLHPLLDCANAISLSCGQTYYGSSSSEPSFVGTYGCNTWTETGPERIHSITMQDNGSITATISGFTGDLDVYILASCDPNDCVGSVSSSEAVFMNAIAGHTYYIVVDADDGSGSAYDLTITCTSTTENDIINNLDGNIKIYLSDYGNVLNIESEDDWIKEVVIYNTLGKTIFTTYGTNRVDLSTLSTGIYYARIITRSNHLKRYKFFK